MRADHFTNTEHDAGLYEAHRGVESTGLDDRPTRGEAEREACEHLHQTAECDAWICNDCGVICDD